MLISTPLLLRHDRKNFNACDACVAAFANIKSPAPPLEDVIRLKDNEGTVRVLLKCNEAHAENSRWVCKLGKEGCDRPQPYTSQQQLRTESECWWQDGSGATRDGFVVCNRCAKACDDKRYGKDRTEKPKVYAGWTNGTRKQTGGKEDVFGGRDRMEEVMLTGTVTKLEPHRSWLKCGLGLLQPDTALLGGKITSVFKQNIAQ